MTERQHLSHEHVTRRYRIGIRIWEAGEAFINDHDLAVVAQPFLQEAAQKLNETVQLAILDGLENVYIAKVEADHFLRLVSKIGSRIPAYTTGLGKVLLAALPERELLLRLENAKLESFTERTITSVDRLVHELQEVRERGYAIDTSEFTLGVYCVAVPVRAGGKVVAAMSSSVPTVRVSHRLRTALFETLGEQADSLSKTLGYTFSSDPDP
jgi:IclR family KDG regulon transcriptional repressor